MKKNTLFAALLAAAICAMPLAGCDSEAPDGKPFEIENYATELPESMSVSSRFREIPAFTTMQTIHMRLRSLMNNPEMALEYGTGENEDNCRLYSMKREAAATGWYASISVYSGSSPYLILTTLTDSSDYVYQIAWPTGELLLEETFTSAPDLTTGGGYYETESGESVRWYGLTYYPEDGEPQAFYTAYADGAWKKLSEKDIYGEDEGYKVGDSLGVVKTPLADPVTYPDYIYKDYGYVREGSSYAYKYTFYKGNDKLDSVTVFNGAVCGVVGHYFYYYDQTPVSMDSESGYNVEIVESGSSSQKLNTTLRRYDFVNGKDEKVDLNYYFTPSGTLYNKKTNDFDRILVHAYKENNGVTIVSQSSPQYTMILDDEAHLSFDLTAKNVSTPFYQLSEDRFLMGRTIVDKDLNTVVQLPNSSFSVWKEQSLMITSDYSGYIAVDYDGKVALAGMNGIWGVCGNHIIAYNKEGVAAAFSKAVPEGKTMIEITGNKDTVYINDLLYVQTENNIVFYDMEGKQIGEFEGALSGTDPVMYDGKYFFSANDGTEYVTLLFK